MLFFILQPYFTSPTVQRSMNWEGDITSRSESLKPLGSRVMMNTFISPTPPTSYRFLLFAPNTKTITFVPPKIEQAINRYENHRPIIHQLHPGRQPDERMGTGTESLFLSDRLRSRTVSRGNDGQSACRGTAIRISGHQSQGKTEADGNA